MIHDLVRMLARLSLINAIDLDRDVAADLLKDRGLNLEIILGPLSKVERSRASRLSMKWERRLGAFCSASSRDPRNLGLEQYQRERIQRLDDVVAQRGDGKCSVAPCSMMSDFAEGVPKTRRSGLLGIAPAHDDWITL